MGDLAELLAKAFPRHVTTDGHRGQPFCGWCGHERLAWMALCRPCWRGLTRAQKAEYIDLDIEGRARWILERKPKAIAR